MALLIPANAWVRVAGVLGGIVIGMIHAGSYVYETTEHRALKAGYPRGTLRAVRDAAHAEEREAERWRYEQEYRSGGPDLRVP